MEKITTLVLSLSNRRRREWGSSLAWIS